MSSIAFGQWLPGRALFGWRAQGPPERGICCILLSQSCCPATASADCASALAEPPSAISKKTRRKNLNTYCLMTEPLVHPLCKRPLGCSICSFNYHQG